MHLVQHFKERKNFKTHLTMWDASHPKVWFFIHSSKLTELKQINKKKLVNFALFNYRLTTENAFQVYIHMHINMHYKILSSFGIKIFRRPNIRYFIIQEFKQYSSPAPLCQRRVKGYSQFFLLSCKWKWKKKKLKRHCTIFHFQ